MVISYLDNVNRDIILNLKEYFSKSNYKIEFYPYNKEINYDIMIVSSINTNITKFSENEKIILISNKYQPEINDNIDYYLYYDKDKIPLEVLITEIFKIIDREYRRNNAQIIINDRIIDFTNLVIYDKNKTIKLTERENEILKFLYLNKNRIISRQEIFNHLKISSYYNSTRFIDVHINNIRKKLGIKEKNNIIISIYGTGYKLII